MGFFRRFFGGNKLNESLSKISELLDENIYWTIIAESLSNSKNQEEQEEFFKEKIQQLSPEEIIKFSLRTSKLLFDIYSSEMWCAAYIMNEGCSDDCFYYFRGWVISRGREVYYKAKENPDSLAKEINSELDFYNLQSFDSIIHKAFEHVTGKNIDEYILGEEKFNEGAYPSFEFNWDEEDPQTMKAICPNLFDILWK